MGYELWEEGILIMYFSEINYIAVVLGGIIAMVLGFLWYGPLFSRPWMRLVGLSAEKIAAAKDSMAKGYLLSFISALVMSTVLFWVVKVVAPFSVVDGAFLGGFLWIGFIAYPLINAMVYAQKPFKLFLIDGGYYLVVMVINGILFTLW